MSPPGGSRPGSASTRAGTCRSCARRAAARPGAGNLNPLLQEALTPYREGAPERRYGGRVFRAGDKATQLRNNYDKGTAGVVAGMPLEDHALTVRTDQDQEIGYDFDELDELARAYAVTIRRSQGSEYPAVVIPLTTSAWMMLQRNLLYTGITRAKKLVVLAGSRPPPPDHPVAPAARRPSEPGRRPPVFPTDPHKSGIPAAAPTENPRTERHSPA